MPQKDIAALLGASDPEIVRRRIELHVERLEERLARQRRILGRVDRRLRQACVEPAASSARTG
jgi:putative heme degradation protein